MTTTFVTYDEYMAALGWPEHHVMVGPDWWGCLCGTAAWDYDPEDDVAANAARHADRHRAATVQVNYHWESVEDIGPTAEELHEFLWGETDGFV